jgi:hypothetical protein
MSTPAAEQTIASTAAHRSQRITVFADVSADDDVIQVLSVFTGTASEEARRRMFCTRIEKALRRGRGNATGWRFVESCVKMQIERMSILLGWCFAVAAILSNGEEAHRFPNDTKSRYSAGHRNEHTFRGHRATRSVVELQVRIE